MATSPRDDDLVTYKEFTGLRNDVRPERFATTDLAVATNCDIDSTGRIARRKGRTKVITGTRHSLWASDTLGVAFVVSGAQFLRINPDFSESVLGSGLTLGAYMSYVRVNDRVYFSNGYQNGVFENGAVRSWGLPIPPLPVATVTVGAMPAGTYQYVLTYLRADGQESGAGVAGKVVVPVGGGLTFTVPASTNAGVVSKALYLTTANSEVLFLAQLVANGTTTVTYTSDTTELATPLLTQFKGPPPIGHLVGFFRGRTYVAVGDLIYPSDPFSYELFDLRRFIQLDGRVTLFAPLDDKAESAQGRSGVFVGTDRSCGAISGADPSRAEYVQKAGYGAVLGALDYVDGTLYGDGSAGLKQLPMWMTTEGICVGLPDMEVRNLTRSRYGATIGGRGAAQFQAGPDTFTAVANL